MLEGQGVACSNGLLQIRGFLFSNKAALEEKRPRHSEEEEKRPRDSEEEEKRPSKDYTCCGVDLKPFLPLTLALSTVIRGVCFFFCSYHWLAA